MDSLTWSQVIVLALIVPPFAYGVLFYDIDGGKTNHPRMVQKLVEKIQSWRH